MQLKFKSESIYIQLQIKLFNKSDDKKDSPLVCVCDVAGLTFGI